MKRLICICLFSLLALAGFAQQRTLKGKVSAAAGILSGASVYEKDVPGNGVLTDNAGNFQINLRGKGILVVQAVGYLMQEVNVAGKTAITVTMALDAKGLEDVIVVGYGTKKRITNAAAVSSITGDEIRQTPSASLQNTLAGRITGLTTQQRSGQPGSDGAGILIRGVSSMNGNGAPLLIVDDLEYNGSISEIDPDQVESLTILKDAATTAVYGIKGANGVIVITTRRGKTTKPRLSFRSETAGQAPTFTPKFVDAYTAATLRNQARANDSLTPEFTQADIQAFKDGSDPYGHPNVDWRKTLLRPFSLMTTNTFNIQGGTDKAKYFVSAGYLWQNGMVKDFSSSDLNSNYYYKRYNFRSNMDLQATKDLLLSIDLSGVVSERNEPNILGRNNRNNVLFEIYDYAQLPPFAYALYNPDGSYGANPTNGGYSNNVIGRFALGGFNRSFDNDLTANLRATQKLNFITKGLSAKFVMGYNAHFRFWRSQTRSKFPAFAYNAANNTYTPFDVNVYDLEKINLGYYADGPNSYKKPNWQASLNYDRTFGGHHVNVLALINQSSDITGINSPIVLRSNVLRGTYDYKQRYLLEVTQTYSGSSKFDKANRFSWFPSYSLGWVVSQEQFFRNNVHFIDLLKLRGSWGRTASDNLGNDPTTNQPYLYAYIQNYTRGGSYSIADISRTITGIQEGTLGTTITWEKENQTDFGVDMTMFKGKLTFTADYFRRHRYDILIQRQSVSQILGVGVPPVNLGVVQNNGFEVELGYNGRINKVTYSVRANMSYAKNKILFQDEAQPTYPWLSRTGHPIGSHIGYTWVGFYQSYDEIAKSPTTPITARPGDLKYADLNGDGKIDPNDQSVLAYPNLPNTIIGFNGTVGYKGLTLAFTFQSALNFTMARPIPGNYTTRSLDAWTPENNVNPSRPRLSTVATVSGYNSTFWYKRMDYLRLKTIQLGYDLPKSWIGRLKLSNARIYTSGYNLFTFMLKGRNTYDYDPEAPEGTEGGDYPVQKIVNVGLQITF